MKLQRLREWVAEQHNHNLVIPLAEARELVEDIDTEITRRANALLSSVQLSSVQHRLNDHADRLDHIELKLKALARSLE